MMRMAPDHTRISLCPTGSARMTKPRMKDYQRDFLDFAIRCQALRFGEFTLKSGRVSPYFFNTGMFDTGERLARLGDFYARAVIDREQSFDMVFGPSYKGVPLACGLAIALATHHGRDVPYAFNRKETKTYGEGGLVVGHVLQGRVLIVDDVISAGTSVRESVEIIRAAGATPVGVAIAVDRQERGTGTHSAVQQVEQEFGLRVTSIADLETLLRYLAAQGDGSRGHYDAITAYRHRYGT